MEPPILPRQAGAQSFELNCGEGNTSTSKYIWALCPIGVLPEDTRG